MHAYAYGNILCPAAVAVSLLLTVLILTTPASALRPPDPKVISPITSSFRPGPGRQNSLVPPAQQISDSKTQLFLARILAWTRDYAQALDLYRQILNSHPENDQVRREAARTAYWAKDNELGDSFYRQLFTPSVDALLALDLVRMARKAPTEAQARHMRKFIPQGPDTTVFGDYEALVHTLEDGEPGLPPLVRRQLQEIAIDLKPEYIRHKQAWLEYRAKQAMWNKRFIPAMRTLQNLVHFEPDNQEARFDLAQTQCILGLCDLEKHTYARLLDLEPKHNLARQAMKRQEVRSAPDLAARWSLWEEEGRGELSQMRRQRMDVHLDIPICCRHGLSLIYSRQWEDPKRHIGSVQADSLGIHGRLRLNAFWSGDFGLRVKDYRDQEYETQETGHLGLQFNAWDLARLRLRFQRENLLPNAFALVQGIQADTWRAEIGSNFSHALSAKLGGEYIDYSDGNSGLLTDMVLGYVLTEHPRELKVSLSGQYRQTNNESRELWTTQNQLSDIIHPYWTPQDYAAGAVTLEWRHDLSEFQFCGTRKNIYHLQLTAGTDTDTNPALELKGMYALDLTDRWSLELEGMVHESEDWDAMSVIAGLAYRF